MTTFFKNILAFVCIISSLSAVSALQTSSSTRMSGIRSSAMRGVGRGLLSTRSTRLFSSIIVDEPLKIALQTPHPYRNITPVILEKVGRNLHRNDKHPLGIIKSKIEEYCNQYTKEKSQTAFEIFDNLSPLVNTKNCFDDLRVGPDHPSRRQSDTYYVTGILHNLSYHHDVVQPVDELLDCLVAIVVYDCLNSMFDFFFLLYPEPIEKILS